MKRDAFIKILEQNGVVFSSMEASMIFTGAKEPAKK
jgi:hypothetical protein